MKYLTILLYDTFIIKKCRKSYKNKIKYEFIEFN